MLAKTVIVLVTLRLASGTPSFTVVAEPGFGWATPVVFCCFGESLIFGEGHWFPS